MTKEGQYINFKFCGEEEANIDAQMLTHIFNNLLSNAIKYSPEGAEIKFHISNKNGLITTDIEDQGIGIPKEEQSKLFDRFFRAKNAQNIQGTGLGLNIVKNYVDLVNGEIRFESEEGKGTKFNVVIPQ